MSLSVIKTSVYTLQSLKAYKYWNASMLIECRFRFMGLFEKKRSTKFVYFLRNKILENHVFIASEE